ncbi:MAG: hypothetical protein KQJ78_20370 [Deltaproteobacteria bacterium]|nr:hypothetical protein [Deltaproteobacteria bacterium]
MGTIVDLAAARQAKMAARAFARWESRVGHRPSAEAKLSDLPDRTLGVLAELKEPAVLALYDLVLGVRDWGRGEDLAFLAAQQKMEALDAYLFLADQVRFETMRRLGWVEGVAAEKHSLLDLATHPTDIQARDQPLPPRLLPAHHRYQELEPRLRLEPEAAIRSLIPEALAVFLRKVGE